MRNLNKGGEGTFPPLPVLSRAEGMGGIKGGVSYYLVKTSLSLAVKKYPSI